MNIGTTEGTAKAAITIIENIRPRILRYREDVVKLREVLEPVLGFHRDRALICEVGEGEFNDILSRIKASQLEESDVDKFRKLLLGELDDPSLIFPDYWEVWRCPITKFHLYEVRPFAGWLALVSVLHGLRMKTPSTWLPLRYTAASA